MFRRYADAVSKGRAASGDDGTTLAAYLREIAKVPLLTPAQERDLAQRIHHDGDEGAIARLVECNLRFVVSCARRYRTAGVPLIDLIHEGNLGLIEAARRFDPARNVRFITYAVWWIREAMAHVLADQTRAFSFPPKLFPVLGARSGDVSIDEATAPKSRRPLADTLAQDRLPAIDEALIHRADLDDLSAALQDLDRTEQQVVRWRFGLEDDEPRTLQEIGSRLHLSRERVRQIESRAKQKLRQSARLRSRLN
jgi:RNA polymerase primary sigma factor